MRACVVVLQSIEKMSVVKIIIMKKSSPASGKYKGIGFDEQEQKMERCSILFKAAQPTSALPSFWGCSL